jgi:hypothetical protein
VIVCVAPVFSNSLKTQDVAGVTITMSGAGTATTTTNSSGAYSFATLPAGTYNLLPSLAGYTYSPAAPAVIVSANTVQNFAASSAIASSSISGTITYAGAHTGATFIRVHDSGCTGNCNNFAEISIPNAGGAYTAVPFTIRGLPITGSGNAPGSYVVKAFIDVLGTGFNNASDPVGASTAFTTVAGPNTIGLVTVANNTPPAPAAPTQTVTPGNNSAFILYQPPQDANGKETATSYTLDWGTDTAASTGGGTATFPAQGNNNNFYVQSGLTNGAVFHYKISAINVTASTASAVFGPVTINAPTGTNTVSGTVTFSGTTATGPMFVGVHTGNSVYFTLIASPGTGSHSYSISGVPSGSYQSFAVIDMNNNGIIDTGDITYGVQGNAPTFTVSGNTTNNLTLTAASRQPVSARVTFPMERTPDTVSIWASITGPNALLA